MTKVCVDLKNVEGKVKIMHAVNNGPAVGRLGNFDAYKALEIPYARYHDSALGTSVYGGDFSVDVHRIFRNFELDENDPKNYIFEPTDIYVKRTIDAGTKPYYRLGAAIEHGYKFGTYPPKDFHKWARICENIIRHYTEGWGDGFYYDIEYWELWNEPDCIGQNLQTPCWQGTIEQFIDFYEVAAKYLKSKFPKIKLGGPAFTSSWNYKVIRPFLKAVKERNIPMDFYSFHGYMRSPELVVELAQAAMETFKEAGLEKVEFHLNEWNYMRSWTDAYEYSLRNISTLKGASFVLGSMCAGQISEIDMMMYYDFRPSAFNGVFSPFFYDPLKSYYSFKFFSEIYKLGGYIKNPRKFDDIYTVSATNGEESGIILTHFNDDENTVSAQVELKIENVEKGKAIEYYLLDKDNDGTLVKTDVAQATTYTAQLEMPIYNSYYIKIK